MTTLAPDDARSRLNLDWLLRVRWFVWGAQALLAAWVVLGLHLRVETTALVGLISLGFLSNAAARAALRTSTERALLGVMLLDVVLFTAVFFFSGGPFNPFTALYLVNVAFGTLTLSRGRQLVQLGACLLGFASLFPLEHLTPGQFARPSHAELMQLHLPGMLIAFVVASAFIVASMERLLSALRDHDTMLQHARQRAARNEKLAALTTLAAGAAHELATPLGTIALAGGELDRALRALTVPEAVRDDVTLIRQQVVRCREILSHMSVSSGEPAAEPFTTFTVDEWVARAQSRLHGFTSNHVSVSDGGHEPLTGPASALELALASLLRNGLQAGATRVELRATGDDRLLTLEVSDDGSGLSDDVLAHLGEPFFTTREPGHGMGLGVFLARTLAHQLGGDLSFQRRSPKGTVARFTLERRRT